MEKKPIALACDHAGYPLKEELKKHLEKRGIAYTDYGTNSTESVNYPEYAHLLCQAIGEGKNDLGILICGTGVGMSIAANKHSGIRAAVCSDTFSARYTRMHNDANVLVMPGRFVTNQEADEIMTKFFSTPFEGGRHQRRVEKIPVTE